MKGKVIVAALSALCVMFGACGSDAASPTVAPSPSAEPSTGRLEEPSTFHGMQVDRAVMDELDAALLDAFPEEYQATSTFAAYSDLYKSGGYMASVQVDIGAVGETAEVAALRCWEIAREAIESCGSPFDHCDVTIVDGVEVVGMYHVTDGEVSQFFP